MDRHNEHSVGRAAELRRLREMAALDWRSCSRRAQAEPLLRRSLGILEKALNLEHPDVATSLNNLAVLLKATNRLSVAEPFFLLDREVVERYHFCRHAAEAKLAYFSWHWRFAVIFSIAKVIFGKGGDPTPFSVASR